MESHTLDFGKLGYVHELDGSELKVRVEGGALVDPTTLDRLIWDDLRVHKKNRKVFDAITVWTDDVQFEMVLSCSSVGTPVDLFVLYAPVPDADKWKSNKEFWRNCSLAHAKKLEDKSKENLVVWNRYEVKGKPGTASVSFERKHVVLVDPCRHLFQTVPIVTSPLFDTWPSGKNALAKDAKTAAKELYELLRDSMLWVVGTGSATARNLISLSQLLFDRKRKVVLVTGAPGTGKEAFCRALHFGDKLLLGRSREEAGLFTTTARELATSTDLAASLKDGLRTFKSGEGVTVFIDEVNKLIQDRELAKSFFSEMLRILENPNEILGKDVRFVLAASEHLDELARIAQYTPIDFWTRVSHQLRLAHPLDHVSRKDGEAFLAAYFLSEWWKLVKKVGKAKEPEAVRLQATLFAPRPTTPGSSVVKELSDDCSVVYLEFLKALVPVVEHDALPVRGVRSIVTQVFSRVLWHKRYRKRHIVFESGPYAVIPETLRGPIPLATVACGAIQEVLAVLNASRPAPKNA